MDWAPVYKPKGHWFDSQTEHMPGCQARSSVGGAPEATTHWFFSSSPSPSLPFLKIKIKSFFLKGYLWSSLTMCKAPNSLIYRFSLEPEQFWLPLAQNNSHTTEAHLWVTLSEPLQQKSPSPSLPLWGMQDWREWKITQSKRSPHGSQSHVGSWCFSPGSWTKVRVLFFLSFLL